MVDLQELICYFDNVAEREIIPYKNSQMILAVSDAVTKNDKELLKQFSDSMIRAYIRANPNSSEDEMRDNAIDTLVVFAHAMDHNPGSLLEFKMNDPLDCYRNGRVGRAMIMLNEIYKDQGIDLIQILERDAPKEYFSRN